MSAQTTMSPYPIGADFCEEHHAATQCAISIGVSANLQGRDCSFRDEVLPVWRARAFEFGFTDDPTKQYAVNHNLLPEVARHIEWMSGVRYTKRAAKCDGVGVPNATPVVTR
jgi:hypothetical protein